MLRMLESTAMNVITSSTCTEYMAYQERSTSLSDCFIYSGIGGFHLKHSQGVPLSVVQLTDGAFGALARSYHSADTLQYHFLGVTCGDYVSRINGMDYFRWSFDLQAQQGNNRLMQHTSIKHFCLLLPRIVVVEEEASYDRGNVYTLITSEWNEMLSDGTIGMQPVVSPEDH